MMACIDRAERSRKAVTKAFQPIEISSEEEDEEDGTNDEGVAEAEVDDDDDDDTEREDNEATPVAKPRATARR